MNKPYMHKTSPLASVIIPIHNAEDSLVYCLDSVLKQTFQDFEIILINDGSTDNTENLIKNYLKKYPDKIRYFSQKNLGVASTRNKGILKSKGKYLFFIDNDDFINQNYIETFISAIEENGADMVIGGYKRINLEGNKVIFQRDATPNPWTKYMFLAPWGRVYKKEAVLKHKLHFLKSNIGEDVYINVLANLKINVKTIDYNGYNWVYNPTSLSNENQKGLKEETAFLPLITKIYKDTKNIIKTEEESLYLEYFFLKHSIYYLLHSGKGVEYRKLKKTRDEIFKWIDTSYPLYKKNIHISPFSPKGEAFSTRMIVWIYIFLQNLHLENIFLRIYSKL